MVRPTFDIDQLTADERFELIERLWDSLRKRPAAFPMSAEESQLVEARRSDHRRDPSTAIPWEEVRADLVADQDADEMAPPTGSSPAA